MRQPKYRLSPNEVERIVKEETERKRKLRIVQVREQAKTNAAAIRNDVRREKCRLLNNLASEIKDQLNAEKGEKLRKLEEKYENTLRTVGEGHKEVYLHGDGQNRALMLKKKKEAELAAQARFKMALDKEKKNTEDREFKENCHIYARQAALETERERAAQIASLPPPPPDISVELEKSQRKAIPMVDMKAFATTHYHIPEYQVVKAVDEEQDLYDAKALAEETDLKLKQELQERRRALHEQAEKARIRGNQALEKEILKHDYGDMLQDLSLLQRKDRRRRQVVVADLPKQVFIPPERCMEERREREIEMQQKFDELYMQDHGLDSDLHSMDISDYASGLGSTGDSSLEARASIVAGNIPLSRVNPNLRGASQVATDTAASRQPNTVLKQLLSRIKEQRSTTSVPAGQVSQRSQRTGVGSMVSGESRAEWDSVSQADPLQGTPAPEVTSLKSAPKQGEAPSVPADLSNDDSEAIDNNERLIEELRQRIELIESEKARLNQQFQPHKGQLLDSPFKDSDVAESTLREVDIDSSHTTQGDRTQDTTVEGSPPTLQQRSTFARMYTSDDLSTTEDLASAAANLRPLAGILKGVKNSQYELLTSNGFPPLPVLHKGKIVGSMKSGSEEGMSEVESDGGLISILKGKDNGNVGAESRNSQDAAESSKTAPSSYPTKPASSANPPGSSRLSSSWGHSEASLVSRFQSGESPQAQWLGVHQASSKDAELAQRVREYQASAQHRHLHLDEDTIHKVREYQQKLMDTESDRKKMLADIRADIEKRRGELLSSQTSSLSRASHNLYQGLTGQARQEEGAALKQGEYQPRSAPIEASSLKFDPKTWEPIKPFQADGLAESKGFALRNAEIEANELKIPGKRFEENVNLQTTGKKGDKDKLCKSLVFDDLDPSAVQSPAVSWKDVLNDTGVSSVAPCDESRIMSSEEERGSPILPRSSSVSRLETSSATSNASINASITGSSSLNGSALVARAEERRLGFERRQLELREQLAEIAHQKDSILQRYQDSQGPLQGTLCRANQASQRDTQTLREAGPMSEAEQPSYREQQELVRLKLAVINAQLGAEGSSRQRVITQARDVHTKPAGNSRRSSSGSGGSIPSAESYLEEISFQRIISPSEAPVLPASAFTQFGPGSGRDPFPMAKPEAGGGKLQTWASVLSSSSNSSFDGSEGRRLDDSRLSKSSNEGEIDRDSKGKESPQADKDVRGSIQRGPQPPNQGQDIGQEMIVGQGSSALPPGAWAHVLTEHRPHELSTILEVDTPSSSARILTSGLPASRGLLHSLSASNQSLSSSGSLQPQSDLFPNLPFTFPSGITGGHSVYQLGGSVQEEVTQPGGHVTRARRSLDFSDRQPDSWPEGEEDLWSTPMPSLVELTPLKASPAEGELSSFMVSGYSDYLRAGEEGGLTSIDKADDSALLSSMPSMSLNEVSLSSGDHNDSSM